MDTIYALATGEGKAGVAIVRTSGSASFEAVKKLAGHVPPPRQATVQKLRSADGEVVDEALVLIFEEGKSFTGERVVEFHTHGSRAVIQRLIHLLSEFDGFRLAEPGEFTKRALLNGRLDLAQVEGLADLIDAETDAQRRQAFRLFDGELSQKCVVWRDTLIEARALLEATIDFADEDVPVDVSDPVKKLLSELTSDLEASLKGYGASERVRNGFEVALIGAPNVGKSTLLNKLSGRDAAITSEIAGTTRDVIEVRMDLDGLPVTFLDTAGLRETDDKIEAIGVARSRDRARKADFRIVLVECQQDVVEIGADDADLVVLNKADTRSVSERAVSGVTGCGIGWLIDQVKSHLGGQIAGDEMIVNARQKEAVTLATIHLKRALVFLDDGSVGFDLASEETRLASGAVKSIIGDVSVEDVFDHIFARFCIGK